MVWIEKNTVNLSSHGHKSECGAANTAAFRAITTHHACARALVFPHHNHLFQLAKTGSIREYETLQTGPDEPVLQAVADWLLAAKSSS